MNPREIKLEARRTEQRLTRKLLRTSQHRTKSVKICNSTSQTALIHVKVGVVTHLLEKRSSTCSTTGTRRVTVVTMLTQLTIPTAVHNKIAPSPSSKQGKLERETQLQK